MKRHSFDGLSFIAGLVFAGIGLAFLLAPDAFETVNIVVELGSWFWALVLIAIGVAVIAPAVARRNEDLPEEEEEI